MKKSLLKILSVIFSCLFEFSCSNLISGDNSGAGYNSFEKVNIRGTIGVKGALPASIANARSASAINAGRTAIPSLPEESEYYFFKTRDLDSGEVDNAAGYAESDGSYSVGLVIGRRYEVTAGISSDTEHENVILSTSWETPFVTRENASSLGKDILLEPGTEGNGTVELLMTVASSIKNVSCDNSLFTVTGAGTSYTVKNTETNIRCGSHSLTIKFLDESGNILFYNTQSINVFPNMKTDKWVTGGGSLDPIDASGNYNVTSTLIEKFARTQIYVGSTPLGAASSAGIGSVKSPFASFMQAIDYITNKGDATIDYTIWVSGTITETSTIGSDLNDKAHSITISGTKGNAYDSLNGNKSGTVLSVTSSVPVTIKYLQITNGSAASGGGINMTGGAKVTLESGALIGDETEAPATSSSYGNKSGTSGGGGIYISNGTLIMKKGSGVSHNYDGTSDYSGNGGGGIYCNDGNITVEKGAVVSYNATTSRGGGIKLDSVSGKSINLTINGGEICNNDAVGWGGGLFSSGNGNNEIKMTSGKLSGNKSSGTNAGQGPGGGAVFMDSGKFTMSGDSEISENTAKRDGGGILLKGAGCEVNLLGGIIKDNNIDGDGTGAGAVKVNSTAGTLKIGGSIQIPYGYQGTKGIGKNEIFLENGKFITVTENITSPSPVATVRVQTWNRGSSAIVVKADGTNVTDLSTISDITNMFVCSEEKYSTVLSDDKKSLYLDAPIYVSKTVTNAAASKGTKANPYDSIASAISAEMNDSNTDYLIYVVGEVENQTIADSFKKASHAKSLTIKGLGDAAAIKGTDNESPALAISSNVPVTIMNLTITEGKDSGIKIWESDSNVTLGNGAKITGNSSNNGGGIYNAGNLKILSGAEISGNTANNFGGGIYNTYVVTMEGGIISGNTNAAIHNEGVVKLSGSAYIPAGTDNSNVVYLSLNTKISITGSLTPPEEANGIVAIIKPQSYDSELFEAGTGVTLANEVGKFRIVQPEGTASLGTGLEYGFDSTGKYTTSEVKVVPLDNDMDEIKTAINTLISNSTEPVNLCFTSEFNPVGEDRAYILSINGKTVNISASSPVTLDINATYHYQYLFEVKNGGKLTLGDNIKLDGKGNLLYGISLEGSGSELILDGAEITNCWYSGGGAIVYVPEGTVLRIKGNTKIHNNKSCINVKGGTVYMESGEICKNDIGNIGCEAVIVIQNEGKFIKTGGRIYDNTTYKNGNYKYSSQVKFYGFYGGGYWGTSDANLTSYKTGNRGVTDNHFFLTEADVEAASQ